MSGITLKESTPASIPTPDTNKNTIFIDSTAVPPAPAYKDDTGTVTTLRGSVGITGSQGPMGPVMILSDGLDGEPGLPGPQGPAGSSGGASEWDGIITKAINDTVTGTNALTNDSELVTAALVSGGVYKIEFAIVYSGTSAAADYRCQFAVAAAVGSDVMGNWTVVGTGLLFSSTGSLGSTTTFPNAVIGAGTDAGGAGTKNTIMGAFTITVNATTPIQFKFAQNTTTAANSVTTYAGSYLKIKRLA